MLRIKSAGLSRKLGSKIVEDPTSPFIATDGELKGKRVINEASDGRHYFVMGFTDPDDIMSQERFRVIFQTRNSDQSLRWTRVNPSDAQKSIGKITKGEIITKAVPEYVVPGTNGQPDRVVTSYTAAVFNDEVDTQVFARAGHQVMEAAEVTAKIAAQPVNAEAHVPSEEI